MRYYELSFWDIENFFYKLAELRDAVERPRTRQERVGTVLVKHAFPIFQKGGVIMDVTNPSQAQLARQQGLWR